MLTQLPAQSRRAPGPNRRRRRANRQQCLSRRPAPAGHTAEVLHLERRHLAPPLAAYGSVRDYANLLGQDDIAELLEETLNEEKAADEKLTGIAKSVNSQALKAA